MTKSWPKCYKKHNSTNCSIEVNDDSAQSADNITDSLSVVANLAQKVKDAAEFFTVIRRKSPLIRLLLAWSREIRRKPDSIHQRVRVRFIGESEIDSGAMAKEFLTSIVSQIGSNMFSNGQPYDSTFHVQNGNFKSCGEIAAACLAQGGPPACFLAESVYNLMVNPNKDIDGSIRVTIATIALSMGVNQGRQENMTSRTALIIQTTGLKTPILRKHIASKLSAIKTRCCH